MNITSYIAFCKEHKSNILIWYFEADRIRIKEPQSTHTESAPATTYRGIGYKIGSENEQSQIIAETIIPTEIESLQRPTARQLTFWRNGFSISEGPLLRYDDPSNHDTLVAINNGRIPLHLFNVSFGQDIDVQIIRRTHEDYFLTKKKPLGFHGLGQRLGK